MAVNKIIEEYNKLVEDYLNTEEPEKNDTITTVIIALLQEQTSVLYGILNELKESK